MQSRHLLKQPPSVVLVPHLKDLMLQGSSHTDKHEEHQKDNFCLDIGSVVLADRDAERHEIGPVFLSNCKTTFLGADKWLCVFQVARIGASFAEALGPCMQRHLLIR